MKLANDITGSGEPLVLLHGMGSSSNSWKMIRPALQDKFQVITFDLPGHGKTAFDPDQPMDPYSLALLIKEQLDELGIERAHLAGNSLGGWIALEIAAAFPERTKSVIGPCWALAGANYPPFDSWRLFTLYGAIHLQVRRSIDETRVGPQIGLR